MDDDNGMDNLRLQKDAGSMVGGVASDLKTAATEVFDKATTEVRTRAQDARLDVANDIKNVASALRQASAELRDGSAPERALGSLASNIANASDAIRDADLGEILQMATTAARKNPMLFLGGAAVLGFAVSRFAKASGSGPTVSPVLAEQKAQVAAFVDEGNPNTQPLETTA